MLMTQSILIVKDHPAVRASLLYWMGAVFPGCELWEARSGEEAVTLACAQPPDVVLMDLGLPRMNGMEATRRLKAIAPQAQVVIVTLLEGKALRADAAAAGACAYVPKRTLLTDLMPTLAALLRPSNG
jgi:two-component system NarL family response regulator